MPLAVIAIPTSSQFSSWRGEPNVSFENDSVFIVLEPFLTKDGADYNIDPYDGGIVKVNQLIRFNSMLEDAKTCISKMDCTWVVRVDAWTQGDKNYSREIVATRSQVLGVIDNLIRLASFALETNSDLIFIGD